MKSDAAQAGAAGRALPTDSRLGQRLLRPGDARLREPLCQALPRPLPLSCGLLLFPTATFRLRCSVHGGSVSERGDSAVLRDRRTPRFLRAACDARRLRGSVAAPPLQLSACPGILLRLYRPLALFLSECSSRPCSRRCPPATAPASRRAGTPRGPAGHPASAFPRCVLRAPRVVRRLVANVAGGGISGALLGAVMGTASPSFRPGGAVRSHVRCCSPAAGVGQPPQWWQRRSARPAPGPRGMCTVWQLRGGGFPSPPWRRDSHSPGLSVREEPRPRTFAPSTFSRWLRLDFPLSATFDDVCLGLAELFRPVGLWFPPNLGTFGHYCLKSCSFPRPSRALCPCPAPHAPRLGDFRETSKAHDQTEAGHRTIPLSVFHSNVALFICLFIYF